MNRGNLFLVLSLISAASATLFLIILAVLVASIPEESFMISVDETAKEFLIEVGYPDLEPHCSKQEIITAEMVSCLAHPPGEPRLEFFCSQTHCVLND